MPSTSYESDLTYPGGGDVPDTVTVSVGEHAHLPGLEPNYITIESSVFKHAKELGGEAEQIAFHTKEDFEVFVENLLNAAEDAYDDEPVELYYPPALVSTAVVNFVVEIDLTPLVEAFAAIEQALVEIEQAAQNVWNEVEDEAVTEKPKVAGEDGEDLAPELSNAEWNEALEDLVRGHRAMLDKPGSWRSMYGCAGNAASSLY